MKTFTKISNNEVRIDDTIPTSIVSTIKQLKKRIDEINEGIAIDNAHLVVLKAEKQAIQDDIISIKAIGVAE